MKRLIIIGFLVSFSVISSIAQKFQKTDFEGYYCFNGNANDLSINNRNGIVNCASLVKDRSGNSNCAYSFNGSNSYIIFNEFNPNNVKTFNFWIKPLDLNNAIIVFFSMREPLTANGFSFYKNNERYLFEASDGVHVAQVNLLSALDVNKYSMITCKFGQDGILYLYLNGRLNNKSSDTVPEMVKSAPLFIGSNYNTRYSFEGVIDDVMLYNKSLTDKDIDDLYNGNLDEGLVGKYLFKGNAIMRWLQILMVM